MPDYTHYIVMGLAGSRLDPPILPGVYDIDGNKVDDVTEAGYPKEKKLCYHTTGYCGAGKIQALRKIAQRHETVK